MLHKIQTSAVTQDPRYRFTKYEEEPLLLRRKTPLSRRSVVYLMGWSAAFTQPAVEV